MYMGTIICFSNEYVFSRRPEPEQFTTDITWLSGSALPALWNVPPGNASVPAVDMAGQPLIVASICTWYQVASCVQPRHMTANNTSFSRRYEGCSVNMLEATVCEPCGVRKQRSIDWLIVWLIVTLTADRPAISARANKVDTMAGSQCDSKVSL